MMLYLVYEVPLTQHINAKRVPCSELRLGLSNGEQRLPHGGMALFIQLNQASSFALREWQVSITGRAVVRQTLRASTGLFHFTVKKPALGEPETLYTLPTKLTKVEPLPSFLPFPQAHVLEFQVTNVQPAHDPCNLFFDPKMMEIKEAGEIDLAELVSLLGGFGATPAVRFDSEGGFSSN